MDRQPTVSPKSAGSAPAPLVTLNIIKRLKQQQSINECYVLASVS